MEVKTLQLQGKDIQVGDTIIAGSGGEENGPYLYWGDLCATVLDIGDPHPDMDDDSIVCAAYDTRTRITDPVLDLNAWFRVHRAVKE